MSMKWATISGETKPFHSTFDFATISENLKFFRRLYEKV
nr:MAG TPA: hypothetical protein [Caudoviricetes sp.]